MFYLKKTHPGVGRLFEALQKSYDGIVKYLDGLTDAQIAAINAGGIGKLYKLQGGNSYRLELPLPKSEFNSGKTRITMEKDAEKLTLSVVDVYISPLSGKEHPRKRMSANVSPGYFNMTQEKEHFSCVCGAVVLEGDEPVVNIVSGVEDRITGKVEVDRDGDVAVMITDLKQQLNRFATGIGMKRGILLPDVQKSFAEKRPGIVPNPSGR